MICKSYNLEANFNLYKSAKLNIFQLFTYEQLELWL